MIRKILVALDGSPRAPGVFAAATEIASRFGAELIGCRAILIPPEFPPAAHVGHGDPLPVMMAQTAEAEVRAIAREFGVAALSRVCVRYGQPWREIVNLADELDVDLIVLGSHGYHGLDYVLGTTAGKVANLAHRNVLVVHARDPVAGST